MIELITPFKWLGALLYQNLTYNKNVKVDKAYKFKNVLQGWNLIESYVIIFLPSLESLHK